MNNRLKIVVPHLFVLLFFLLVKDSVCESLIFRLESFGCGEPRCLVDLRDIFREPWEQLFIFQGFNTPEDISETIGFEYQGKEIYD